MRGVDISYANGEVDFDALVDEGIEFVIVRLGYGNRHLDDYFYDNYNGAVNAGLKVGVYYYSYALTEEAAKDEAEFLTDILYDAGIKPTDLEMGVWFDMEDADGYKDSHGMPDNQTITDMCKAFCDRVEMEGFEVGVYASYDWLINKISYEQLGDTVMLWNAEWGPENDIEGAALWQYTDKECINGCYFDGNEALMDF